MTPISKLIRHKIAANDILIARPSWI